MADLNWPIPKFHFDVEWPGGEALSFTEVTGLVMETQTIDYRAGDDQRFLVQKVPGLKKTTNIALKKGLFKGDDALWQWFNLSQTDPERRKDITIKLLNEEHNAVFTWTVRSAFPMKISSPDLKADANEIAIETFELAHEGIELVAEG
jgi:phage tail-like protein